ncbi:MAG: RpiB/LacA/LacB family sugar-phosphate isomerase [Patescibacteria group bacterium]
MPKRIYLAADHAGFELKEKIKKMLTEHGHEVVDNGAHQLTPGDDYPGYMRAVADAVARDAGSFGVLFGGSGEGEAMVANRVKGIRAAEFYGGPLDIIKLSREHNNANILSIGARFVNGEEAERAILLWLKTDFSNEERHVRRIREIEENSNG